MRTRRFYKYLMAMIIALGTTANVFAQERNLKIYFNEYSDTATGPRILVTDDHPNDEYDVPLGVTVSRIEGVAWAGKSRFFEWITTDVTDRVMADYLSKNDKKNSHLKLTFTDFPYEVNVIQWNAMNDLLSGSVTDFFKNYRVTTKCVPMSGNGFAYTEENWSLNLFSKQTSFTQMDIPWKSGAVLNGLTSFEISELYEVKIGLFGWTLIDLGQTELSDKNRTFIKAGWNGSNTNSNITDSDDSNWAFKVKFTLPDIRMRSYKCTVDNNFNVTLGQTDNNIIVGERAKHALRGYIAAHAGAVVPIEAPTNPDDIDPDAFHYKYEADETKINIHQHTGVIYEAKVAGDIPVTVKLMRGSREVCSYTQTIHVYAVDPNRPEIAIGFLNGNKGYDVTVGDQNAQIQGIITKYGENITLSNGTSGYHFEYSEDSNGEIIDIDPLTGKITAKKEGDVVVSAVLKNGGTIRSNTYTYSLHVFAQHEGLDWKLEKTYTYTNSSNKNDWSTKTTNSLSNKWESKDLLMVNTTINGSSDWKQIACFTTPASQNWRGICQTIQFDLRIPKYTKVTGIYPLAGNLNIGSSKGSSIKYGFESKDLDAVDAATADTNVKYITWLTQGSHDATHASTNRYATQIIADATSYNNGNIGNEKDYRRNWDNSTGETHITRTRYLAIMAYLHRDNSYPGDASFGFKNIPTYEYYSTVTYYKNDGTEDVWYKTDTPLTTTDKTKSFKMPNTKKNLPERAGYEFLGWSTDPNATTAEYPGKDGDFYPYDDVNGGGKGPVDLYAVWRAIPYIVTLNHNYSPYETEEIVAYYGQPMPEDESIVAPTRTGYDFTGYRTQKDITPQVFYYDAEMKSAHIYDKTSDYTIFANWEAHTTKITFDFQGGNGSTTEVTATYGEAMPTATAPSRTGYTFAGYYYYSEANGQGTKYYNADMTSVRTWNVDEPEVTLHAKWIGNTYAVTLDPQGGTGGSTSVTAAYGQPLPSGLTAPTKPGYEFRGYYGIENSEWEESQGNDIYYGGKQYYDKDMNGVEPWDKTEAATIYAHWAPATYIVTLDANGGVLPINVVDENKQNFDIAEGSNGVITITYKYKTGKSNTLVHAEAKKPGYELLGWYVGDVKVIDASETSRNCVITDNGGYWTENGLKYNHAGDLTLTAQYRKKYKYADNVITFGKDENGNPEKVEPDEDWLYSVVNDLVGAAKDVYDHEAGHPQTMVFDLRESINRWTSGGYNCPLVMEDLLKSENSEFISPNVLVYFNSGSYDADKCNNAILSDYTCPNLYVADRYQMKIPYAFNAGKATYERNKLQIDTDDPMWQQSHKSIWGTLCLPYPIKNNNTYKDVSKVIFYELRKHSGSVMQYYKLPEDAVIPANTPVLYERTVGISSAVTIEEISKNIYEPSIYVPENPDITAVVKSYADAPEPSIHDWEFRGNLKTRVFYGANYVGTPEEADAEIVNNGDIYYFKENKFTHLTPTMTKMVNGQEKWYNAGKMTIYPYRAYFYQKGSSGSSAKVSAYSILVVDEDGATLDITNTVFGDGEGDGKIYDLNGIRVMQPVKGRLYIVNGQKKVYR